MFDRLFHQFLPFLIFAVVSLGVLLFQNRHRVYRLFGYKPEPPDRWCIDVNDITGRWARMGEIELRHGLKERGVLIHNWRGSDGLTYNAVVRVLQEAANTRLFERDTLNGRNKYRGRPMRIRNLATSDFIMCDVLGIKAPEDPEKADLQELNKQWSAGAGGQAMAPMTPNPHTAHPKPKII